MNHFEHIQETFSLEHLPTNIRAQHFLGRWPVVRHFKDIPVGLEFLPSEGSFSFCRGGQRKVVKFNGRNLQFHALYKDCYRYGYELETALLVSSLCRGSSPFFDIGSNWGYFSLLAASLPAFDGPIYAFEPNPRTFADLTATIEQTSVADRVKACQIGLGREECEMTVAEVDQYNTGLSQLTTQGAGQKTPVKSIDALGLGAPGVIKIDAEGMEMEILIGATRTLAEAKPFVIFENVLNYESPQKTYAPIRFLEENAYSLFLPVLEFTVDGATMPMTYGHDYTPIIARGAKPRLGVAEISTNHRFLLDRHVNLLGLHSSRVPDLWTLEIADLGKI